MFVNTREAFHDIFAMITTSFQSMKALAGVSLFYLEQH
jgi:hypothetical protein